MTSPLLSPTRPAQRQPWRPWGWQPPPSHAEMIEALRWQPLSGSKRCWVIERYSFYPQRGRLTARHAEVLEAIYRRHGHG